jgi:hypothetical protein
MNSNMITIGILYAFIALKSFFFGFDPWNFQLLSVTYLMCFVTAFDILLTKLSPEVMDIFKFIAHFIFVTLIFSIISNIISFMYGTVFYLGFINTIAICLFISSGVIGLIKTQLITVLSTSNTGRMILDMVNYCYNLFLLAFNYVYGFILTGKTFLNDLTPYFGVIFNRFYEVHTDLKDNSGSRMIKNKLDDKYSQAKSQFIQKVVQPYFFKSFTSTLNSNLFNQTPTNSSVKFTYSQEIPLNNSSLNISKEQSEDFKNLFKEFNKVLVDTKQLDKDKIKSSSMTAKQVMNSLGPYEDVSPEDINMNFLTNTAINEDDTLDDDLDADIDSIDIPVNNDLISQEVNTESTTESTTEVPEKPVKTVSKVTSKPAPKTAPKQLSAKDKKKLLRQKIAAKKNQRNGGIVPGGNPSKKDMANILNMPGMEQMVQTMMQGDNLQKLLSEIPPEKIGFDQMPQIDQNQMKQIMQGIMKKK